MNKKYALSGAAAAIAIAGVIYFGTGANQQASVANLMNKTSEQKVTTIIDIEKESKAFKENLSSIVRKANVAYPGTSDKKRVIETDGICYLVGPAGRIFSYWEC